MANKYMHDSTTQSLPHLENSPLCKLNGYIANFSTTYFSPLSAKKRKHYIAISIGCVYVFADKG